MPKSYYFSARNPNPRISFAVRQEAAWTSELMDLALASIAITWQLNGGGRTQFAVGFFATLPGEEALDLLGEAGYVDADTGIFQFSYERLARDARETRTRIVRAASHEAMHAIQYLRGSVPQMLRSQVNGDLQEWIARYQDDPHEQEADATAGMSLKGYCEAASVSVPESLQNIVGAGDHTTYRDLWSGFLQGKQLFTSRKLS